MDSAAGRIPPLVHVLLSVLEHAIHQPRQTGCHGRDRRGCTELGTEPFERGAPYLVLRHNGFAAMRNAGAARFSTGRGPRWYPLPPVILLSGQSPSQEAQMRCGGPPAHIPSHCGDDGLGGHDMDSIDAGQIDAAEAKPLPP